MFSRILVLMIAGFFVVQCKHSESQTPESDPKVLAGTYGANQLYLWNKRVQASDKKWLSCWYYKEANPNRIENEKQAMIESVRLNHYALADTDVNTQLQHLVTEKFSAVGGDLMPCGISAVSVYAILQTGGFTALALGINASWAATNCVKNAPKIIDSFEKMRGASDGKISLANGETSMGKKYKAAKSELDMFREAIKRAVNLGRDSKEQCPKPIDFKSEIEKFGMGI